MSALRLPNTEKLDKGALATHVHVAFGSSSTKPERLTAVRAAEHLLKTALAGLNHEPLNDSDAIFPTDLLKAARRGYLVTIARQMNGCFESQWFDACSVMMRRLVEAAIIETYEGKGIAAQIRKPDGAYFQLTELVSAASGETKSWSLSRNAKQHLPKLRDLGHLSAHGRKFTAQKSDIERVQTGCGSS